MKSLALLKRDKLRKFCKECKDYFGIRLVSIVGYGSFFEGLSEPYDLDLVIILDEKGLSDILKIKEVLNIVNLNLKVDIHVVGRVEFFKNPRYFSQRTQGCYFIEILKRGTVLSGNNFYRSFFKKIDKVDYSMSILMKIRQYNYEITNYYFNHNSYNNFDTEVIKKCRKIIIDLGLIDKKLPSSFLNDMKFLLERKPIESKMLKGLNLSTNASRALHHYLNKQYIERKSLSV